MKLVSQAVLIAAIVAAVAAAAFILIRGVYSGGGVEIVLPTATPETATELKVYLTGAVRSPGVFDVGEGDRLAEVVEAAGGATEDADLTAVNLAVRMKDEDHWHIPRLGETPPAVSSEVASSTGKIDLNSASPEQLQALPGIGEVKAQAIYSYREKNGHFSVVDDILAVSGIGSVTLESIRDLVEVR